jgi:ubiquinone/menaquinone biosynthesis C-methylase UbiE
MVAKGQPRINRSDHQEGGDRTQDWWTPFYAHFRPVFDSIPVKSTNTLVRYLIKKLGLRSGMKLLDCPCGIGRLALPLAKAGVKVTGVDFNAEYLEEVALKAKRRGLSVRLVQSDMRRIDFRNEFHVAINLWTSFGYFASEADNLRVLRRAYQALRPGGRFLLHVINRDWILANFQSQDWWEAGQTRILEKRYFDYSTSISYDDWTYIKDGKEVTCRCQLRAYSFHELLAMFRKVGFIDIVGFGSERDTPISRDARMLFVFGTKPKSPRRSR